MIIASYMELGREEEARAEAERFLAEFPEFSIQKESKRLKQSYKDPSFLDRHVKLLRKAGLPE